MDAQPTMTPGGLRIHAPPTLQFVYSSIILFCSLQSLESPKGPTMYLLLASLLISQQPEADWKAKESAHLTNVKQLTFDFVRAGEGYFSPDGRSIIFQAEEKETGNPFYQI